MDKGRKEVRKSKDSEIKLKSWELRDLVFTALGLSLIAGGTLITLNFPIMLGSIIKLIQEIKNIKVSQKKIRRVLKNLEKKEILYIEEKEDKVFVHLKNRWNQSILQYSIKSIIDFKRKKKKWNGKWFLVFFDVPEQQRVKRDNLRKFLKKLGFYQCQQSVYLFPYECEKEISLIKKIVEGGKYIKYVIAEKIEDEDGVKTFFKI